MIYRISPFEKITGYKIVSRPPYEDGIFDKKVDIQKCFDTKKYDIRDLLILKTLMKYEFLNIFNLERAVNDSLKGKLKKPSYRHNIDKLLYDGAIVSYSYEGDKHSEQGSAENTIFYGLTPAAHEFLRKKYPTMPVKYKPVKSLTDLCERYSIESILEKLSLNQWHINVAISLKQNIKEEAYYGKRRFHFSSEFFRSYFRIRTSDNESLIVIGIPAGKNEENFARMTEEIVFIDNAIKKVDKVRALVVIICDNIEKSKDCALKIKKALEFEDAMPLFTEDTYTMENQGLQNLYVCRLKDEKTVFATYDIIV